MCGLCLAAPHQGHEDKVMLHCEEDWGVLSLFCLGICSYFITVLVVDNELLVEVLIYKEKMMDSLEVGFEKK